MEKILHVGFELSYKIQNMKTKILLLAFIASSIAGSAQNDIDAMRYSQLTFGGTARFASMAGSMGALGGDISTLSFNPAGIAVYKKSELTITPSFLAERTSTSYNQTSSGDRKLNLNFGNVGLVATFKLKDTNRYGWESFHIGIGYNRTNSFQMRSTIEGYNTSSSLLDTYVANANGHSSGDFDQFSTGLAWSSWLINDDTTAGTNQYNHVIPNYGEYQRKSIDAKGSMGETDISFGGSYRNKVLIGATIGFANAKYSEEAIYEEKDAADSIANFSSFTFTQNLDSKGSGINLKLGVIVKATDWLRLGAAVHTPTAFYSFSDDYSSSMSSDLENGITYQNQSPIGHFDYSVITPFRAIGSIGFIANKLGLLNVDYEYVDYSAASLRSSPNVFADVNSTIRTKYHATQNLRIGGEFRLDPVAIRLGYALYGSPFVADDNKNATRSSYTGGVGFRSEKYFIDFAYVLNKYSEYSYLYDPNISNPVKSDYTTSSFMVTFGLRF